MATAWLDRRAAAGRIVIVTSDEWGLPADGVWLHLDRDPRVRMFSHTPDEVASNAAVYSITRGKVGEPTHSGAAVFKNPGQGADTVIVLPLQPARSSR